MDGGPLSDRAKFQLDWSGNGRVMVGKRLPMCGRARV